MLRHLVRSALFAQPVQFSMAAVAPSARRLSSAATAQPTQTGVSQTDKFLVYSDEEGYIKQSPFDPVEPVNLTVDKYVWRDFKNYENDIAAVCIVSGRQYTYAQLRDNSAALAVRLQTKFKLGLGDIAAICLPNLPEYPIAVLGALEAGLSVTTINPIYTAGLQEILRKVSGLESEVKFLRKELKSVKVAIRELQTIEPRANNQGTSNNSPMNIYIFSEKYVIKFPLEFEDELTAFNNKLKSDNQFCKDYENALISLYSRKKSTSNNLANIFKTCIARELLMNYTVSKKIGNKKVFKNVNDKFYNIVYGFINKMRNKEEQPDLSDAEFSSCLSACFTNAKDWDGHRKDRK